MNSILFYTTLLLGCVVVPPTACGQNTLVPPAAGMIPASLQAASSTVDSPDGILSPTMEKDLFDSLDLSLTALAPVEKAVALGDDDAAERALAGYFRQRTNVPWKFDPRVSDKTLPYNKQIADDAVNGKVEGGLVLPWYPFPNRKIDWLYNPTLNHPGIAPNAEWQWGLCRMGFWNEMGSAYRATGNEKYAKAWVQQLRSFAAQCPPPGNMDNTSPSAWRTIEAGIRMSGSWPNAYFSFLLSPSVSDKDLLLYVYECRAHADYLEKFNTRGNWLTMEMNGLYTVGAVFPEFKQAAEWRNYAAGRMFALEKSQFLPDGAQEELSTGYHNVALDNITGLVNTAKLVGRMSELPYGFVAPIEKAYDFDMYMSGPGGDMPKFNDSWPAHVNGMLKQALQYFPDRQDFLWFATQGKQGHPPVEISHAFDWAGYYVMRSSWDANANYLVFRAGPAGAGHQHQDKLNLIFWPYGREVLFNSGGGTYEHSKWRDYSINTFSKNTVLVDGLAQHRETKDRDANISKSPIDARWQSTPQFDFAAGTYNEAYGWHGLHPATHTRRVLFIKPDLVVIADTLIPNDGASHTYQARWQLLSTQTKQVPDTGEVLTADAGKANLDIVPLNPEGLDVRTATAQTEPELLGWNVWHDGRPANPATTVLQTRHGVGTQTFLTLLVPIKPGDAPPVTNITATPPGRAEVTFSDGRKLSIAAAANPAKGIEATETLADGTSGRHVQAGAQPTQ